MLIKNKVVYIPYERNSVNKYVSAMIKILGRNYEVVGGMSDNFIDMFRTKAVFLNWVENDLNEFFKKKILLYKMFGSRIVWIMHNKFPHQHVDSKDNDVLWLMSNATDIIVHSIASIKVLPDKMQKKAVYVPHIMYDVKCNPTLCDFIKNYYNIENNTFVYLYFGLIRPYKNLEKLMMSFSQIKSDNARLLIVGMTTKENEEYAMKLAEAAQKDARILFCPQEVPQDVLNSILELSDVVVLPYKSESYLNSGTMIHALSAGKPVIAPSFAMADDFSQNGFVYVYDDDIVPALKDSIGDPVRNKKIGSRAREYIQSHNNYEVVSSCLIKMLKGEKHELDC